VVSRHGQHDSRAIWDHVPRITTEQDSTVTAHKVGGADKRPWEAHATIRVITLAVPLGARPGVAVPLNRIDRIRQVGDDSISRGDALKWEQVEHSIVSAILLNVRNGVPVARCLRSVARWCPTRWRVGGGGEGREG
jgi:hypothetical protein